MSTTPRRRATLDGQVAIVTGAARGIGRGIAERLAGDGAKVVVWDRDLSPLDQSGSHFAPAAAEIVDVADYESVERAFSAAVAAFGKVDILVNNAGVNGPVAPTWEYALEDWDRVVAIDMTAVFYCCRVAARHMRERRSGRLITVASIGLITSADAGEAARAMMKYAAPSTMRRPSRRAASCSWPVASIRATRTSRRRARGRSTAWPSWCLTRVR